MGKGPKGGKGDRKQVRACAKEVELLERCGGMELNGVGTAKQGSTGLGNRRQGGSLTGDASGWTDGKGEGGKLHGDHWDKFSERDVSCAWIIGGAVQSWMPGRGYKVKDMCMVIQRSDALFIAVSKGEDRERARRGLQQSMGHQTMNAPRLY